MQQLNKIVSLLKSTNDEDLLIGISLLSREDNNTIIEVLESLGERILTYLKNKIVVFVPFIQRNNFFVISNGKMFFISSSQIQYSYNGETGFFDSSVWPVINLDE